MRQFGTDTADRHALLWLPALACAAVMALVMFGGARAEAAATRPNVVLILVDAMRADRLGPYGFTFRNTTPNLNRFAARSAVFENAISQAAWTVPSIATLFSGVDPQAHRVLSYRSADSGGAIDVLAESNETIAEQFKRAGYSTHALLKSIVVDKERGMAQGFDSFTIVNPKTSQADGPSGSELTDAAITHLKAMQAAGTPFFTYLHYMDTHSPYKAPEPYYSKYRGSYSGPVTGAHRQMEQAYEKGGVVPTADDIEAMKALYDADVEYWDSQFGRLMTHIVASGLDPNTIVMVVADHGEAFWEHGKIFHGEVYQENLQIPFIVKAPGIKAGRYQQWSQLVDAPPTLADLAGIKKSSLWTGVSHAPSLTGTGAATTAPVYAEYGDLQVIIDQTGKKMIVRKSGNECYDLAKDPKEKASVCTPAEVERLKKLMETRVCKARALAERLKSSGTASVDDEQAAQLAALGYVDPAPGDGKATAATLGDCD